MPERSILDLATHSLDWEPTYNLGVYNLASLHAQVADSGSRNPFNGLGATDFGSRNPQIGPGADNLGVYNLASVRAQVADIVSHNPSTGLCVGLQVGIPRAPATDSGSRNPFI